MTEYTEKNQFEESYFPESWDQEDIAFLAHFLQEEFDAKFMVNLDTSNSKYSLLLPSEDQSTSITTPPAESPFTDPGFDFGELDRDIPETEFDTLDTRRKR